MPVLFSIGICLCYCWDNHEYCYGQSFMVLSSLHSVPQKIDEYTEPFACACGKHNDRAVLRSFYPFSNFCTTIFIFDFNTIIYVCKHNENARFLLWDRECTELIGQSADEVNSLKIAVGACIFKHKFWISSNVLAFKIKVQPKYKNSAVLKCSSDLTLISDVLNMLPNAKVLFYWVNLTNNCYIYMLSIC